MRVVAGGAALGAALLVATALVGGVVGSPDGPREAAPDRLGPATAIQPELREALLTGRDLPPARANERRPEPEAPPAMAKGAATRAPTTPPPPPPPPPVLPETGMLTGLCRALFEDPAGLAALWHAVPADVTSRHTVRPGGAILDQVLSVFDAAEAAAAYQRLRGSVSGCSRFEASLASGNPVTVLLQELTGLRPETTPADDSYTMVISFEDGGRAGWLAVDRVGPVVSVLRYIGPTDADEDVTQTRLAALQKLQPLLRALRDRG